MELLTLALSFPCNLKRYDALVCSKDFCPAGVETPAGLELQGVLAWEPVKFFHLKSKIQKGLTAAPLCGYALKLEVAKACRESSRRCPKI